MDPLEKLRAMREGLGGVAELLLALLDDLDGDEALEDGDPAGGDVCDEPHDERDEGDLEPSLCGIGVSFGNAYECEGDTADDEPSLGWTATGHLGGDRDLELQCEDEGSEEGV
ncbi:hypothetical protein [Hansschlegelia zhihuaiae]|jgi:hypothetical protein|uniref:Uncharacterized protein n=1 Tax=Hansschlegelia zhihuaiae TaxID=405005 RepID=A0A4Q0MK08_9HYPH|nr:hypothetical protein [Hansschlegelia zhihuaiae]RXF73898.1 hypothetical protein EK403_07950 [Hansschlegelia zhihuaiae]